MTKFVVEFAWDEPRGGGELALRLLEATERDEAKLEAALLFAEGAFSEGPPVGYRVLNVEGDVIFSYPPP